jgi:hypothetical protein
MAYILSNDCDLFGCYGQHLFKFDPTNLSPHPSAWIKHTIDSPNNCYHLGLTLGRGESVLYAFSFFNSLSTVSLL